MSKNFGDFIEDTTPETGQYVVGYDTPTANGERRFAIGNILSGAASNPGGQEPQFQFNSGNTFQGAGGLTYDYRNHRVAVGTSITGGTFTPAQTLHISGSGEPLAGTDQCRDIESGVIQSNFGAQVGTGAWDTGIYDYLFMASGLGVFLNYELLPSSNPNVKGQVYRDGGNRLYISNG